jgi:pimeloyl-ACP methyl ester carboxylesterase
VTLPTLVLAGSKDRSVKPEHTQTLADGIPRATLQRFPGAGHLVQLERAEQIASAITEFVASCA